MTKQQQIEFVRELSDSIQKGIVALIESGKIPEQWDGHELRMLLEHRHKQSADMSLIRKEARRKRAQEFWNTIIIENL